MNWTQILAEFPRSILRNELPMQTLAVLERKGLATEEELSNQLDIDVTRLKQTLLDLKMNRCIEYGRNYVTLTTRGKLLVDRFGLKEPIVDDLLDHLDLKGGERNFCKHAIISYRDDAFKNYLNTLGTIRVWNELAEDLSGAKEDTRAEKKENQIGMLTLLLRDLRNWIQNSQASSQFLQNFDNEFKYALSTIRILDDKKVESTYKRKLNTSVMLLDNWEQGNWDPKVWHKAKINSNKVQLLVKFYLFQANTEPDNWFDVYWDTKTQLESGEKPVDPLSVDIWKTNLSREKPKIAEMKKQFKHATEEYRKHWAIENLPVQRNEDLITSIMLSNDLQDLAQRTGYKQSALAEILRGLTSKCLRILSRSESALGE